MAERRQQPLKVVGGRQQGTTRSRTAKTAQKTAQKTVKEAAEGGKRRELLVATRTRIAVAVDNPNTPPRDLASLTRRLLDIAKEIESLDAAENTDDIGEAASTPDASWPAT